MVTPAIEEETADAVPAGPPVAGLVASAGGLDAFRKFFTAMPADSGIAFVLVPHLDPQHESLMVELMSRHTAMPVVEVAEAMPVEANHVYIIPPNKYLTIQAGTLRLTGPVERGDPQTSIDLFLRSLAEDQRENSICIVLSGTGAHGSLGLKAVKSVGGMAMVQEPATADYPAMPRSALATGLADYVLPVDQMPAALIKYVEHGCAAGAANGPDQLNQILALLRARTKFDFRYYRKNMLDRRVRRRMGLSQFNTLAEYLAFLRDHPDELKQLARDLLISVTSFFRDPAAWQVLQQEVIAPLVSGKEPDAPILVWSVGCATGEEPYSVGMLILEQLAALQKECPVRIFATDADEDALEVARAAKYPENISADVSRERLQRFFMRVSDSSFQVSKQLRETVTFARQNLIGDPPFSKLDLVVCRNLLIYLEPEAQKRILQLLHFALNDTGVLYLGPSETIGRNADLFEPISAKWRIYRRIGTSRSNDLQFPVMQVEPRQARPQPARRTEAPPRLGELAQNFLLRRFALACVVINRNYEVLHFAGPTEDYLAQPAGAPTHDLLSLARQGLESKLRVAIQRAIRENAPQSVKGAMMRHRSVSRRVNIDVEPLNVSKQTEGLLLISFQEQPSPEKETLADEKVRRETADSDLVRQLAQELDTTREDLQITIEESESSNEELKASNEEIMSMNEELQSANEELETSKEELQSLNEELNTVNNQLHEKVGELEATNNDMANLLNCTDVATVFLDSEFRIRRFTREATGLFSLIPTDVGRPIGHIASKLEEDDLLSDAKEVLRTLAPFEKEVQTQDGRWWLQRIVPYRTLNDQIDGVVLTFNETTQVKAADLAALRERESRLSAILNTAADAIVTIDPKGRIESVNAAAQQMFLYSAAELVGQNVRMLMPPPYSDEHDGYIDNYLKTGVGKIIGVGREVEAKRKDGSIVPVHLAVSEVEGGKLFTGILHDITNRKQLEREIVEIALLEQKRLGADLHDECGQQLTALGLLAAGLTESLKQRDPADLGIATKISEGLKNILSYVRYMAHGLAQAEIEPVDLQSALKELTTRLGRASEVRFAFNGSAGVGLKDSIVATHLYHIAQEACTNALKHSGAKNVQVYFRSEDGFVTLQICDDGVGIPDAAREGLGLRIMRNRASVIGADLSLETNKPGGTVVTCILPMEGRRGSQK